MKKASAPAYMRRARPRSKRAATTNLPRPAEDSARSSRSSIRRWSPVPRTQIRAPSSSRSRRRCRQEVESLLRIEPADHREERAAGIQAKLGTQRRAAGILAREVCSGVSGRYPGVRRRVPELRIDAVDDPEVAVAQGAQRVVHAGSELGRQRLARETGRHGVDHVRGEDPLAQKVDAVRLAHGARAGRADRQPARASPSRDRPGCGSVMTVAARDTTGSSAYTKRRSRIAGAPSQSWP